MSSPIEMSTALAAFFVSRFCVGVIMKITREVYFSAMLVVWHICIDMHNTILYNTFHGTQSPRSRTSRRYPERLRGADVLQGR